MNLINFLLILGLLAIAISNIVNIIWETKHTNSQNKSELSRRRKQKVKIASPKINYSPMAIMKQKKKNERKVQRMKEVEFRLKQEHNPIFSKANNKFLSFSTLDRYIFFLLALVFRDQLPKLKYYKRENW